MRRYQVRLVYDVTGENVRDVADGANTFVEGDGGAVASIQIEDRGEWIEPEESKRDRVRSALGETAPCGH